MSASHSKSRRTYVAAVAFGYVHTVRQHKYRFMRRRRLPNLQRLIKKAFRLVIDSFPDIFRSMAFGSFNNLFELSLGLY